ncbi:MAG: hypothetical protein HY369_01360 [Candidatus Aenigmarchaeota archaeon]|nr:hypothetical protein [Candidatus Aenigmarchaeota archaeon]
MPCPICHHVLCDHTADERGQTLHEMLANMEEDGRKAREAVEGPALPGAKKPRKARRMKAKRRPAKRRRTGSC